MQLPSSFEESREPPSPSIITAELAKPADLDTMPLVRRPDIPGWVRHSKGPLMAVGQKSGGRRRRPLETIVCVFLVCCSVLTIGGLGWAANRLSIDTIVQTVGIPAAEPHVHRTPVHEGGNLILGQPEEQHVTHQQIPQKQGKQESYGTILAQAQNEKPGTQAHSDGILEQNSIQTESTISEQAHNEHKSEQAQSGGVRQVTVQAEHTIPLQARNEQQNEQAHSGGIEEQVIIQAENSISAGQASDKQQDQQAHIGGIQDQANIQIQNVEIGGISGEISMQQQYDVKKQAAALAAGNALPSLPYLYGTAWKGEQTVQLVMQAVLLGFRGIDTACQPKHYREDLVGEALQQLSQQHGIARESIWLQTKYTPVSGQDRASIPYNPSLPPPAQALQSLQISMRNLRTDYIDSWVLHSPMPTPQETLDVWRAMESAVDQGYVGQIGISNLYDPMVFKWLYANARHKPAVLQNSFSRNHAYDKELRIFCAEEGVKYQTFWTLTANPHILNSPVVQQVAQRIVARMPQIVQLTSPQVFFKFLIQLGHQPITGTTSVIHMEQDLMVPTLPNLTNEEMQAIANLLQ